LAEAFARLEQIPPTSVAYKDALVARAKQVYLSQLKVRTAERLLDQVLEREPEHVEANQLLFSIYTATNRPDRADPVFWQAFRQVGAAEKPAMFRLWFLSQFTRNAANRALDIGSGIVPPDRPPSDDDVIDRFIVFKNREPDEALHYGAMASWWLWKTETKTALEILQVGQRDAKDIGEEVYLSSLVQTLLNQGDFQQASDLLGQWPESERGFNYFRLLGVCQQSLNQFGEAVENYKRAQGYWPGPIDANVWYRLNQCLRELGRIEEAEAAERQTEVVRSWLEERWAAVRAAVDYLYDAKAVDVLIDFFAAIGKVEAVEYLRQHRSELPPVGDSVEPPSTSPEAGG
jgi:tetratricopeptide (TPR) repeat protein